MLAVFKYRIVTAGRQVIEIPRTHTVLTAAVVDGTAVLYALVDPNSPPVSKPVHALATGEPILFNTNQYPYAGTVLLEGGEYILHLFCSKHGHL